MIDYQRIAEEVRNFIESEDQTRDPQLEALAQAYADACKQANARLRRCGDLLGRGLRSEAIHLAQESPELLDVVAALDVAGLDVWENACAMYGLAKPPRLAMETASELNEAYSAEEPLKASLDSLRLLALARAPVIDRLIVTRRLRALDPGTPHWSQDAIELERACLVSVRQDVARVVQSGDAVKAHQLAEALSSPDWVEPPPRELVSALAQIELQGLLQDISHAQSAGEVSKVSRFTDIVTKLVAKRGITPTPAQSAGIAGAQSWAAQQKRQAASQQQHRELCAMLEAAIRANLPLAELEKTYIHVQSEGLKVPETLQRNYDAILYQKTLIAGHVRRRNLIILAVVVVGILGGLVWLVTAIQTNASAATWIRRLDSATAEKSFDEGRREWSELQKQSPSMAARGDVAEAHHRFEVAYAAEADRVKHFSDDLAAAGASDSPLTFRLFKLNAAERLARLESESLKIYALRRKLAAEASAKQSTTQP
jgi:hypothetical protein